MFLLYQKNDLPLRGLRVNYSPGSATGRVDSGQRQVERQKEGKNVFSPSGIRTLLLCMKIRQLNRSPIVVWGTTPFQQPARMPLFPIIGTPTACKPCKECRAFSKRLPPALT